MVEHNSKKIKVEEVEPTILRLAKIFWSQTWRALIILMVIGVLISPLVIIFSHYIEAKLLKSNVAGDLYFLLPLLPILYLIQCFLFRLILGINYKDFTLSFVPKMDNTTPGFWQAIFCISWSYFWRTSIVMIGFRVLEYLYPQFFDQTIVYCSSFILEQSICLFLLRFVVNKQYGKVRLSLLKREIEA